MRKSICLLLFIISAFLMSCNKGIVTKLPSTIFPTSQISPTVTKTYSLIDSTPFVSATIEANIELQNLPTKISTNGGCKLPCVWNYVLGQTSRDEIDKEFLSYKANSPQNIQIGYDPHYCLLTMRYFNDDIENQVIFSCNENLKKINMFNFSAFSYTRDHQKELFGGVEFKKITAYYSISNILNIYGLPEKILIGTWKQDPILHAQYDPFITVLEYDKQGFIMQYISPAIYEDNIIKGCPQEGNIEMVAWDTSNPPDKNTRLDWLGGFGINSANYSLFQDIKQYHMQSNDEFLRIFQNPTNTDCVLIPNLNN